MTVVRPQTQTRWNFRTSCESRRQQTVRSHFILSRAQTYRLKNSKIRFRFERKYFFEMYLILNVRKPPKNASTLIASAIGVGSKSNDHHSMFQKRPSSFTVLVHVAVNTCDNKHNAGGTSTPPVLKLPPGRLWGNRISGLKRWISSNRPWLGSVYLDNRGAGSRVYGVSLTAARCCSSGRQCIMQNRRVHALYLKAIGR